MSSQTGRGSDAPSSYTGQSTSSSSRYAGQGAAISAVRETILSGMSWSSIFGGAFAIAAISVALLALGSGIGLASVSPWGYAGSAVALTVGAMIWVMVTQWIAAACGGYLTGRLRARIEGVSTSEVAFRDTAHGFLAWAVATIFTVYAFASTAASMGSIGAQAANSTPPAAGSAVDPTDYYVDTLFRGNNPAVMIPESTRVEAKRILLRDMSNGLFAASDKAYVAQLISARAGIPPVDASRRVDAVMADMTAQADKARQAAEAFAFFTFLAMLIGAVLACWGASYGGRERDAAEVRA
ncbi:MAG: hypothetical protein KGJ06_08485 [Pseudomonadota bacterium]|nr:hypothetical protein [Pseudomonadota bacterium]